MLRRPGSGERGAPRFRFRPSYLARDPRDAERFPRSLEAALRVAEGLALEFGIRWTTGPRAAAFLLGPPTPDFDRWVEEDLARGYDPGSWVRVSAPEDRSEPSVPRRVARATLARLPPRPADGAPAWNGALAQALARFDGSVTVDWWVRAGRPRPPHGPRPPSVEVSHLPSGFRSAPLTDFERTVRERAAEDSHATWGVGVVLSSRPDTSIAYLARVGALLRSASQTPDGGSLDWGRVTPWTRLRTPGLRATATEVAGLLPDCDSRLGVRAEEGGPASALPLGRDSSGRVVSLPVPAGEGRHAILLGETGMGKSSTLVHVGLLAARRSGVVLLDPVGDTARAFLNRLPRESFGRVTWIAPFDSPVPINLIEALRPRRGDGFPAAKARADLVLTLRRVRSFRYGETPFWGPRLEETLDRALGVAAELPGATLLDAEAVLAGDAPIGRAVLGEDGAAAARELRDLARTRPEEVEGARRLLRELTRNEVLQPLFADPGATAQPRSLVAPGALTVISGEAPRVGEGNARSLLAIYLALLWDEILGRGPTGKTFLLLDEAQWYAHESVAEILRLGRRTNLHLLLATQATEALPPTVREAVWTNAADFLAFRGSPNDAREFGRWRSDVGPADLLALDRGEACLLLGKGRALHRLVTAPLGAPARGTAGEGQARDRSRRWVPAPASAAEPAMSAGPAALLRAVLAEVVGAAVTPGEVVYPFASARDAFDPTGEATRELGRTLQERGALRGRGSGVAGNCWRVDPARVSADLLGPPDPATRGAAQRFLATLPTGPSLGGQPF